MTYDVTASFQKFLPLGDAKKRGFFVQSSSSAQEHRLCPVQNAIRVHYKSQ